MNSLRNWFVNDVSRYRKKWSWYFINIAPRWEALKLDRATMSNRWSRCLKPTTVKTVRWWNEAERAFPVLLSSLRSIEKREHQSFCLSATIKKRQTCGGQKKRVRSEIYFLRSLQFKYITNKRRWCEIFTERTFKYSFAWYLRSDLGKQWDKNASIDSSILPLLLLLYHSKPHETIIDRIVAYTSKFYKKFDILRS